MFNPAYVGVVMMGFYTALSLEMVGRGALYFMNKRNTVASETLTSSIKVRTTVAFYLLLGDSASGGVSSNITSYYKEKIQENEDSANPARYLFGHHKE